MAAVERVEAVDAVTAALVVGHGQSQPLGVPAHRHPKKEALQYGQQQQEPDQPATTSQYSVILK